jgi:hypothetical protein
MKWDDFVEAIVVTFALCYKIHVNCGHMFAPTLEASDSKLYDWDKGVVRHAFGTYDRMYVTANGAELVPLNNAIYCAHYFDSKFTKEAELCALIPCPALKNSLFTHLECPISNTALIPFGDTSCAMYFLLFVWCNNSYNNRVSGGSPALVPRPPAHIGQVVTNSAQNMVVIAITMQVLIFFPHWIPPHIFQARLI